MKKPKPRKTICELCGISLEISNAIPKNYKHYCSYCYEFEIRKGEEPLKNKNIKDKSKEIHKRTFPKKYKSRFFIN